MTEIRLTEEQRREFLQSHNDLHNMLHTIGEANDLRMTDVGKMKKLVCRLRQTLEFVPSRDSDGLQLYYADWMLAEDVERARSQARQD